MPQTSKRLRADESALAARNSIQNYDYIWVDGQRESNELLKAHYVFVISDDKALISVCLNVRTSLENILPFITENMSVAAPHDFINQSALAFENVLRILFRHHNVF